jgi:hypothetical protein
MFLLTYLNYLALKETLTKDKRRKIKDQRNYKKIASPALRDRNDSGIKIKLTLA